MWGWHVVVRPVIACADVRRDADGCGGLVCMCEGECGYGVWWDVGELQEVF